MRGAGGLGKALGKDRRAGSPRGFGHLVVKEAFPCEPGSCGTAGTALLRACRSGHRSPGYFRPGLNQMKLFYNATLPILCIKHISLFSVLMRRSCFRLFVYVWAELWSISCLGSCVVKLCSSCNF